MYVRFHIIVASSVKKPPPEVFYKNRCSENFSNIHKETPMWGSWESWPQDCYFIKKETSTQVFPSEFCEIFKSTYFVEYLRTTASEC